MLYALEEKQASVQKGQPVDCFPGTMRQIIIYFNVLFYYITYYILPSEHPVRKEEDLFSPEEGILRGAKIKKNTK